MIIFIKLCSLVLLSTFAVNANAGVDIKEHSEYRHTFKKNKAITTQLGPRPYYLLNDMDEGKLKDKLQNCSSKSTYKKTDFSIGHRGAAMQFPEHTKESYEAAARMGAGIIECDVTFTKDRELVCRHSQCDLHTTTNILDTPLAEKCSKPFTPATLDEHGNVVTPASAQCCTSDITLYEFKTLKGKMDAADDSATTLDAYLNATPAWRTDLYTQTGTLMSHAESIDLFKKLKVKMTPELKSADVDMPFQGNYTQQDYAQQLINEYKSAGVKAEDVFVQSFNIDDVSYWIANEPMFGQQTVYLDGRYDYSGFNFRDPASWTPNMQQLTSMGVNIIAPPMWMLVDNDGNGNIVPSTYAIAAKAAGLQIITWTLERSGLLENGGGWYYQSISPLINNDGDMYNLLHVLARDVGIKGIFSDWPATVSYYANCVDVSE